VIGTIAVGYDGSPGAQAAARWSFELAKQLGGTVVLIHAVGLLGRTEENQAVQDLEEVAVVLASESGLEPQRARWHVSQGDPCSALLRAADPPLSADLVVVGSRGHRGAAGLPLGSTSHELAEHSSVPIVIIPVGPHPT
jgi:nucleotide-binding universal stress UspA family protein